jgi:hypothetical protein
MERILSEGRFAHTRRPGAGPLPGACTCHDHGLLATGHYAFHAYFICDEVRVLNKPKDKSRAHGFPD